MHVRAADDPESGNDPATAPASGKILRSHSAYLSGYQISMFSLFSDQPPGYDTVQPHAEHPEGHKAADDVAQAAFVIGARKSYFY